MTKITFTTKATQRLRLGINGHKYLIHSQFRPTSAVPAAELGSHMIVDLCTSTSPLSFDSS